MGGAVCFYLLLPFSSRAGSRSRQKLKASKLWADTQYTRDIRHPL